MSAGRFSVLGAASYRRSDGYRHNTDFSNYNAFVRATYDGGRAGFFDLQAGWQDRDFGSNGFYAAYNPDQWEHTATALGSPRWLKTAGRFSLGAAASYRKNFDRYDWTRGTAMNRHNTDNVGAKLWADCDWAAGVTTVGGDYAFNHIYSTNLGDKLRFPKAITPHAKARHTGNLWLRHAKRWRHFDAAASAGVSLTPYGTSALWSLSAGYAPAAGLRLEAGAWQSMRLPTFTDLYYTSPAQINNLDLTPEHAVTYRLGVDYLKRSWNLSAQAYYRSGATSSTGSGARTWAASGIPNRRAASIPSGSNSRAAIRFRRLPAPRDALVRLHHDRPERGRHRQKARWISCVTRRHWPWRCISCGGCRLR